MGLVAADALRTPWLKALDTELLAIGVPCGVAVDGRSRSPEMSIRIGGRFVSVGRAGFAAWWQLLRPRSAAEIAGWIEQERLGRGDPVVSELHSQGLLLSWHDDALADMPGLAPLRLIPIGLGMGSSPEAPDRCAIHFGFVGTPVTVDRVTYSLWRECDGKVPLGEACRRAASEEGLQVDDVWRIVHSQLALLTGGGMALLDR